MSKKTYLTLVMSLTIVCAVAQPKRYNAAEIHQKLRKLNVLGSVLYVAAHPDDENTAVISYYANEELYRTAYLSATRGDGGQNLIGPEIREQLGLIRTQELLAARRTDGGQQFFSRANDFGYSKNPEETFKMWNKEEILADFVWVFRKFRPDVVITRFDDQPPNHGHHTASAILAREAFKLAGDKNAFPEQLDYVDVWQPERIYWNIGSFTLRRRGITLDTAKYGKIPIGKYNPVLGMSYSEISAKSRTMHKSQGFGSVGTRGERYDYVTQWEGSPSAKPFDGINTTWDRVKGGNKVKPFAKELLANFDPANPSDVLPDLLKMRAAIADHVKDDFWKKTKMKEIDKLILAVTGTYLEIKADDYGYTPGDSIELTLEAVNRSDKEIILQSIELLDTQTNLEIMLEENDSYTKKWGMRISNNQEYSGPYWLSKPGTWGRYNVDDQLQIGKPENDPVFIAKITLDLEKGGWVSKEYSSLSVAVPIIYKRNDRVDGEVYRPVVVQPPVMANIESSSLIFATDEPKEIVVRVMAGRDDIEGQLNLNLPEGWNSSPSYREVKLTQENEEKLYVLEITPPAEASEGIVAANVEIDGKVYDLGRQVIEYDHIPTQTVFPKSGTKVVRLDLNKGDGQVGYIMGAGDDIPQNLEQIGYKVTMLQKDDVTPEKLTQYQAVIVGIRAFNTVDWLGYKNQDLFEYVRNGGNLIVQYITTWGLPEEPFSPYDIAISRERVAMEEAEVRFLAPDHRVLNFPNKISQKDFDGWVQERGLYFANEWSENFTPILSSNDPGEPPRNGGLLVAEYGKGYYVYSGYSWFRELPAGVPGAYRLFTNLIELSDDRINN